MSAKTMVTTRRLATGNAACSSTGAPQPAQNRARAPATSPHRGQRISGATVSAAWRGGSCGSQWQEARTMPNADDRVALTGSERRPVPGAQRVGPVDGGERATVTVVLRPRAAEAFQEGGRLP